MRITRNREHRVRVRARTTKEEQRSGVDAEVVDAPLDLWSEESIEALDGPYYDVAKRRSRTFSARNDERQKSLQKVQWSVAANEKEALETVRKDLRLLE